MKNKTLVVVSILSLAFGLLGGQIVHPSIAFARDGGSGKIEDSVSNTDSRMESNQGDSSMVRMEDTQDQEESDTTEDINDDKGDNGNEHRDQVEKIVHTLQEVSKKHSDIDDELHEVIGEMASTSQNATEAIHDLDTEGPVKKFFFGPDFKSLGELRSTIVTTQNHIDRLTKAQEKVTDPAAKVTLEAQVAALKDIASSTQEFVNTHESTFSIFGWLVKLFATN